MEEGLQKIVNVLVAGGYTRAQSSSLSPFDKLTAGLAWCITGCNVDADVDFFYDINAVLASKLKVCDAIELALHKLECPHRLLAHQIQDLDYSALYPVVQWLVKRVDITTQEMLGNQVFSPTISKGHPLPTDFEDRLKTELSQEEEYCFKSSSEKKDKELLMTIDKVEIHGEHFPDRDKHKVAVENLLQQEFMRLKLLREDVAKKNQEFILYRRKLDESPSQSELMQYEQCLVELNLHIQVKLQETRKYFATYNALAEANELTLKEISLLNSINAQFEEVTASQGGRSKLLVTLSNIAKGVSNKLEKVETRFLAEQNSLTLLRKRHVELVAERRRYENLMQRFKDECARNELLRRSPHQSA